MGNLIVRHDLRGFFREEVLAAKTSLRVPIPETTEFYLVQLLCDFSSRKDDRTPTEEPLAFLYKRATESIAAEQVQCYKNLGDVALYVAGYFTDFIEGSMVDVDYYISMGGTAYNSLASLVGSQRHGGQFAELYGQLARQFTELVDVLNVVASRASSKGGKDGDLLKLYDRYARTGSAHLRRQLLARGMLPQTGLPTDYNQ
jgi:hypothetical protein